MLSLATPAGREIAEKYEGATTERISYVAPPKKPSAIMEWFGWFMLMALLNGFMIGLIQGIFKSSDLLALSLPLAVVATLAIRYFYKKKTALKDH